jgi:hypothetical protein
MAREVKSNRKRFYDHREELRLLKRAITRLTKIGRASIAAQQANTAAQAAVCESQAKQYEILRRIEIAILHPPLIVSCFPEGWDQRPGAVNFVHGGAFQPDLSPVDVEDHISAQQRQR